MPIPTIGWLNKQVGTRNCIVAASDGVYSELKNLCVWAKTNAGMGSFYRSQHELVFVFQSGHASHVNTFGWEGKASLQPLDLRWRERVSGWQDG
jgi:hypothetical protein